jgi:hypothetical protein
LKPHDTLEEEAAGHGRRLNRGRLSWRLFYFSSFSKRMPLFPLIYFGLGFILFPHQDEHAGAFSPTGSRSTVVFRKGMWPNRANIADCASPRYQEGNHGQNRYSPV